ncbi:DODA-type extradiol aromatic ring-opening family dioxygenase [Bacillus sp. CGMCC 1.16607]|uniref:DODA-type extradiol aromatic ring-opening family dioxygenase n=1 Tax=Bacillus sp. CGMCC 1.16607 TaxID=3351842 RepID=UPI00363944FE
MQSLFLAHGSPMNAIEDKEYTRFLENFGKTLQPKAIVLFTAHWESEVLTISSSDEPYETIYDFYGFPDELYQMKYPAKGDSKLANRIEERLTSKGIPVKKDYSRGLDHGSWTLLKRLFPQADIPVVQISVNPFLHPEKQFQIGEALRGLGKEDILIIGSGVTVHNLRIIKWGQTTPEEWAVRFDDWLIERIEKEDYESLFEYEKLAPNAQMAVPRPEHFVPLYIAMGSADTLSNAKVIFRNYEFGTLSNLCYQF